MSDELHQQIVAELGETAPGPSAQIERIIQQLGPERARDLLAETRRVEANGGLWLERLNRRRSPGGVFLFLARQSCDDQTLAEIFNERRLPDGSFERLPKPKQNYAFGGDWPNMTPEAYGRLCAAGFSVNFPRLDIVRAFWVAHGEQTLLALAQQARAEKEKTKRRTFSDIFLTLAYAQLPAEAAPLPPLNVPEARYGRVERKKMAQAGNRAPRVA